MLTTAPVLAMPINDATYYLHTDCSDVGASAILSQMQDGKVKVIEYASQMLNKAERSYCATRKVMLALIFGLKHFHSYLIGRLFVCRVDRGHLRSAARGAGRPGSTTLQDNKIWPEKFCCCRSNFVELTPIVSSRPITNAISVLCTFENSFILQST